MKTSIIALGLSTLAASPALAGGSEEHCGAAPTAGAKDIVDGAVASKDHTTLVAAVKAAGLVDTLKGKGPFTVFAPTNAAFGKLPAGTVDTLLQPANKGTLTAVLTYHVVAERIDAKTLVDRIKAGGGKASLKTVQGGTITAAVVGSDVVLTDAKGGTAKVTVADLGASNGVIHVIDTVVMPN
ncbi:MAG: fasciclin domain-containing protein [Deltaproteobacteria bacterium]|nr:fasciclin domain-containing protein [Deltaproteobacteria bacterium]